MAERFTREGVDRAAESLRRATGGKLTHEQAKDRVIRAVNRQENIDKNGGK